MTTNKFVHYVRHFEALHNIEPNDYQLPDPELSALGRTQATSTIVMLRTIPQVDLVVCSPLVRALETYSLISDACRRGGDDPSAVPLIIHADLQEVCNEPCDVGSSLEDLKRRFPSVSGELDTFERTFGATAWREKLDPQSVYSPARVSERAKRIHQWLLQRSEQHILVISHILMLKEIFQLNNQNVEMKNGEVKSMEYPC